VRSHRRRHPTEHVLIVGNSDDLDCVVAEIALLPAHAYGQVFIQAPADFALALITPARLTTHRIDPAAGALSAALAGWSAEWVPDEPDPQRNVTVWIGDHVRDTLNFTP
jgi:hypothetical protein